MRPWRGHLHRAIRGAALVVALMATAAPSLSATYYIRDDGDDSNDGKANAPNAAGTVGQAWQHLSQANSTVAAGDTVFIVSLVADDSLESTNRIDPVRAGDLEDPIVYRGFGSDPTAYRVTGGILDANSHLVIAGVRFTGGVDFMYPSHHIQVDSCIFSKGFAIKEVEYVLIRGGRGIWALDAMVWEDNEFNGAARRNRYVRIDGMQIVYQQICSAGAAYVSGEYCGFAKCTFNATFDETCVREHTTWAMMSASYTTNWSLDSCRFIGESVNYAPGLGSDAKMSMWSSRDNAVGTRIDSCTYETNRTSQGRISIVLCKPGSSQIPSQSTFSRNIYKLYNGYLFMWSPNAGMKFKNNVVLTAGHASFQTWGPIGSGSQIHHNTFYGKNVPVFDLGNGDPPSGPTSIFNNIFVRPNTSSGGSDSSLFRTEFADDIDWYIDKNLWWTTNGVAGDSAYAFSYWNGGGFSYWGIGTKIGAPGTACRTKQPPWECGGLWANPGFETYDFATFNPRPRSTGAASVVVGTTWGRHPDSTGVGDGILINDFYVGAISPWSNDVSDTIPPNTVQNLGVSIEVGDVTRKTFFWTEAGDDSTFGKADSMFICERVGSADINSGNWPSLIMTGDGGLTAAFKCDAPGGDRVLSGVWGTDAVPDPCNPNCTAAYYCVVVKDDAGNVTVGPIYAGTYTPAP